MKRKNHHLWIMLGAGLFLLSLAVLVFLLIPPQTIVQQFLLTPVLP